jgi:hypothetical protein
MFQEFTEMLIQWGLDIKDTYEGDSKQLRREISAVYLDEKKKVRSNNTWE